jgi:hypothetical protein
MFQIVVVELIKINTFYDLNFFDTANSFREMSRFVIQYYANGCLPNAFCEAVICFPII